MDTFGDEYFDRMNRLYTSSARDRELRSSTLTDNVLKATTIHEVRQVLYACNDSADLKNVIEGLWFKFPR